MLGKTSLYTALTIAIMSTLLLMSYAVLQYVPDNGAGEALLIRAPELSTDVWGVFNPRTGALRYGSNVDEVKPIASVTKLFTAYAVMNSNREASTTTITWSDMNGDGQAGKLVYGEEYSLKELLFPLLIESSNDAGLALERVLGVDFVDQVETLIEAQNLSQTVIVEPTGIRKENVSSVFDLARMYAHLRSTYPYIIDITQLRMYITKSVGLINNNPLRTLSSYTGGKHGYTEEAGRTFVGTLSLGDGRGEIGIVVLGSSDLLGDITRITESFN